MRMPPMFPKHPVVLEAVVLDFAEVGPHVDHPAPRDPLPVSVRQRVGLEGDWGLF